MRDGMEGGDSKTRGKGSFVTLRRLSGVGKKILA